MLSPTFSPSGFFFGGLLMAIIKWKLGTTLKMNSAACCVWSSSSGKIQRCCVECRVELLMPCALRALRGAVGSQTFLIHLRARCVGKWLFYITSTCSENTKSLKAQRREPNIKPSTEGCVNTLKWGLKWNCGILECFHCFVCFFYFFPLGVITGEPVRMRDRR